MGQSLIWPSDYRLDRTRYASSPVFSPTTFQSEDFSAKDEGWKEYHFAWFAGTPISGDVRLKLNIQVARADSVVFTTLVEGDVLPNTIVVDQPYFAIFNSDLLPYPDDKVRIQWAISGGVSIGNISMVHLFTGLQRAPDPRYHVLDSNGSEIFRTIAVP